MLQTAFPKFTFMQSSDYPGHYCGPSDYIVEPIQIVEVEEKRTGREKKKRNMQLKGE